MNMTRRLLSAAALLALATPAAGQSLTLTNLKPVLAPLCPKAGTVTTIAALYRELAACAPKPPATPPPSPPADTFTVPWDIKLGLQPTWGTGEVPGPYAPDEGAFRFTCKGDGKLVSDDPLVYPGQPGRAHLHLQWGSADFSAFTTPESLRLELVTNCNRTPYSLNRSQYWMPALMHEDGRVIRPEWVAVYYKRKTASSPSCTAGSSVAMGVCVGLPSKIRFIFGWDQNNPAAPFQGASWYCSTGSGKHFSNLDDLFAEGCAAGSLLVANTVGPNCWRGPGHLSSPDNRSHMAYARYGDDGRPRCPATHPFLIPQQENKAAFTVTADMVTSAGRSRIRLSSDHMLPGAKPGTTLHADYMEAWVDAARKIWEDHCINKGLNCSGGDMGNGQQLVGA
jgi:hypothetical protein